MASRALKINPKKSDVSQPDSAERAGSATAGQSAVAALAYRLWQERGCPLGSDQEDWFSAERQLKSGGGSIRSAAY
jgi:hypothetical protein